MNRHPSVARRCARYFLPATSGLMLIVALAAGAGAVEPRLHADGAIVQSFEPPARIEVPASTDYLGKRRWVLYGYADCDLHVYVQKDAQGMVERLYWIQSEAYVPSRPELTHAGGYAKSRALTVGGLDFHLDTWGRALSDKAPVDSDLEQVEQLVAAAKLRLPDHMAFVRLVHLPDAAQRKELMLIYAERATTDATPDDGVIARMREAMIIERSSKDWKPKPVAAWRRSS